MNCSATHKTLLTGVLAFLFAGLICSAVSADATVAEKYRVKKMRDKVLEAGKLYAAKKFSESAAIINDVQEDYIKYVEKADEDALAVLEPLTKSLTQAHALLELEGVALDPLKSPKAIMDAAQPEPMPQPDKPETPDSPDPAMMGVSFVKEVAPIITAKCGRCHVNRASGGFQAASYAQLMAGSTAGVVIFKGDAGGSRLIEVIESGDMPRGGLKITAAELATLKKWITEGAKFDGNSEQTNLSELGPQGFFEEPEKPVEVVKPKENASISFSIDVAPLLAGSCLGCHGNNNPRANFSMSNITNLMKGGDSGSPISPGKGAASLIVQKLRGTGGGAQMPQNQDPWPEQDITIIQKWIDEGAGFDGPDPAQNLAQLAETAIALNSTHEELAAARADTADKNWKLSMSGIEPSKVETENFRLIGNVGEANLKDIADEAEKLIPKVAVAFGAKTDEPLIKGKLTIYVLNQRYDYSEFGRMVEQRTLPGGWRGHWRANVVDAYGVFIPPRADEYSNPGLLAEHIAGAYLGTKGSFPKWFADGVARNIAESIVGKEDPRIANFKDEAQAAIGKMTKPDAFITGDLPSDAAAAVSYKFADTLMKKSSNFRKLLADVSGGKDFETSFKAAYGGTPSQLAGAGK